MTAPAWLLLRGLTREAAHWGDFPAQLQRALAAAGAPSRVVALDLPGAGTRWRERSPTDVGAMVAAVRDAARAQGLLHDGAPLALLGLSMGGMVAAQWALSWPDEVMRLALVNSSARPLAPLRWRLQPRQWPRVVRVAAGWGSRGAEDRVLRMTSARPAGHQRAVDAWLALRRRQPVSATNALRQLWAAARWRVPAQAPTCPTLLVGARGDALVDPRCSSAWARHWGVPLAEHPWAGHDLPLDDGPWLAATVAAWAAAQPSR